MKHVHYDLIQEWIKDTSQIVELLDEDIWIEIINPSWSPAYQYRFKPELEQQAEPVAVYQWRKQGCADWYDGHPDYCDGGGPYETRTLYTAPPQRKPLTINEVEQILAQHNYEIHGDRARYIVRMTEAAHNIKEQP